MAEEEFKELAILLLINHCSSLKISVANIHQVGFNTFMVIDIKEEVNLSYCYC